MLRRLDLKDSWRSLDQGFWPDDLPAGSRTVVYGHNGSGKSTLSELLLSLADGACTSGIVWEDDQRNPTNIGPGGTSPSAAIAVFTRRWVETNLSAFLDGANASAIVTLGKEAIDAKDEEDRLVGEIDKKRDEADGTAQQHQVADEKVQESARGVQDRIVAELRKYDYDRFTKNRYPVSKVKQELRNYTGKFPDQSAHDEALKQLGEDAPSLVPDIVAPPAGILARLEGLPETLAETPTRVAIQALEGNPPAQTWVEQGPALHASLDHCLFCAGEISDDRRDELARHFDESWLRIRRAAMDLAEVVAGEQRELEAWLTALPAATSLASELQRAYLDALGQGKKDVEDRVAALAAIKEVLDKKIADPSATPHAPEWVVLCTVPSTTALAEAVTTHNDQVRRHTQVTSERMQTVLDHLVGAESKAFRTLEAQTNEFAAKLQAAKEAVDQAERQLDEVRKAQFTTKDMAETLTRDLARVYGKDHLSVAVTADGKSYTCRRGDQPGKDLSDGERTTLSLLYFLRKLEEEETPGIDSSKRIVVIDDPSSSLDREALFATHQWLIDTLQEFGQYVILTHDFNLLRLFIKSHKNAWGRSMNQLKAGDADEARFPRVSFLEMYATSINGERRTRVCRLPDALLNNTSEYAYLFSMVMAGIADSESHERLFLLPNAARRVLEVFASYKAPHLPNFLQQLEELVKSQQHEPYRDVYNFCNRFSHGEGSESIDVLDARAVHGQIRRCMDFLQAIDAEHFTRMCAATGVDASLLSEKPNDSP